MIIGESPRAVNRIPPERLGHHSRPGILLAARSGGGADEEVSVKPVHCAVVGVGMMGMSHVQVLDALPEARLVVCCDIDPGAADRLPSRIPLVTDLEMLLEIGELEAVLVCTPQEQHLPVVEACLDAGLFVFCEKPIAHNLDAADRIIASARRAGGRFAVGHTMRFDPDYIALAKTVASGAIGTPVSLSARRNVPAFEGRLLFGRTTLAAEVGVHDLDLLRWLAGPVERVFAMPATTSTLGDGAVDAIIGTLRFASGAVGIVEFNWVMNSDSALSADYRLAVFGTEGAGYVEMRDPVTTVFARDGAKWLRTGGQFDIEGTVTGVVATEDRHFLATVRGLREWPVTVDDARAALAVALALDRSAAEGRPVYVSA